jgi:hypothetical protein
MCGDQFCCILTGACYGTGTACALDAATASPRLALAAAAATFFETIKHHMPQTSVRPVCGGSVAEPPAPWA